MQKHGSRQLAALFHVKNLRRSFDFALAHHGAYAGAYVGAYAGAYVGAYGGANDELVPDDPLFWRPMH